MTESTNSLIERGMYLKASKQIVDDIKASEEHEMIHLVKMVREALGAAHDSGFDKGWSSALDIQTGARE